MENPTLDNPTLEKPTQEKPTLENPTQLNKDIFLNNLEVVTTTSEKYSGSFGFTEEEVFHALEENEILHLRHVLIFIDHDLGIAPVSYTHL